MKSIGLFTQLATIAISVAIALLYVQPTIESIGQIQSDTDRYKAEQKLIQPINTTLSNYLQTIQNVEDEDKRRLMTYMPTTFDDIAVLRDIAFIVESQNLTYTGLAYSESNRSSGGSSQSTDGSALGELAPTPHSFSVNVSGTYEQIKSLLVAFEQNEYPLEVHNLSISPSFDESIFGVTANITLVTYSGDLEIIDIGN